MDDKGTSMPGQMPSSFDGNVDFYNERPMAKVVRKIKEEPLIPLGIGLTVAAFVNSYRALRRGDSQGANRMFRARIGAQAFTIVAMLAGSMYYSKDREKSAELRKLKEQTDAEEKRQRWIRELEVRDDEEKAMRRRLQDKFRAAEDKVEEKVEEVAEQVEAGTGGLLGKMGLWSQAETTAAEEQENAKEVEADAEKKIKNPKSSLGDLGAIIASQKKDKKDQSEGYRK